MKRSATLFILVLLLGSISLKNAIGPNQENSRIALAETTGKITGSQPNAQPPVFFPIMWKYFPWSSPFGVEIQAPVVSDPLLLDRATNIPIKWVRLNNRISWRLLQPNEGDPIQWEVLSGFENELRALQAVNITPIVVVNQYPAWATAYRSPGVPSYCGPMRSDKYQAFADFLSQLANRYKDHEFNVHIWELGNEPDVDGAYFGLPPDNEYGCWGQATDLEYYGGKAYGEMLKIAGPAIKAADPLAQVWVGGLLLNNPNTTIPGEGRPELFLKGILEAGIGSDYPYFDVVPYHTYTIYNGRDIDYDNGNTDSPWFGDTWGGVIKGKATYLRSIMSDYGVQKPLFVDEISLICPVEYFPSACNPLDENFDAFLQMQASHLVRVLVRGLSEALTGFTWYTLDGPAWRHSGLLDESYNPFPSYQAYQQLAQQLLNAEYIAPVDYGPDFEAYAFRGGSQVVQVVWTKTDLTGLTISIPQGSFVQARSRDGGLIPPVLVNGNYQVPVGFSPVYVIRNP